MCPIAHGKGALCVIMEHTPTGINVLLESKKAVLGHLALRLPCDLHQMSVVGFPLYVKKGK